MQFIHSIYKFFSNVLKWVINWFITRPQNLADPKIVSTKEVFSMNKEPDVMIYTLNLGPYDHDVTIRQVTIDVHNYGSKVVNVPVSENIVDVEGFEDANVTLTIVDIDNKGNKATPVITELVLLDNVSPQPGAVVTIVATREIPGKVIEVPPAPPVAEVPPAVEVPPVPPAVEVPPATPVVEEPPVAEAPPAAPAVEESPAVEEPGTQKLKGKKK